MNPVNDFIRSLSPFIGVSPSKILPLIEKICLEFRTYEPGEVIIYPGMEANSLVMLLSGDVTMERRPIDGVAVIWKVPEGNPLDLPALYGLDLCHRLTARATGRSEIVTIPKRDFRRLYESEPIVLLNLLNTLGRAASVPGRVRESNTVGMWLQSLGMMAGYPPAKISVSLERIASLLSLSENTVTEQLNQLQENGVIKWNPEAQTMIVSIEVA